MVFGQLDRHHCPAFAAFLAAMARKRDLLPRTSFHAIGRAGSGGQSWPADIAVNELVFCHPKTLSEPAPKARTTAMNLLGLVFVYAPPEQLAIATAVGAVLAGVIVGVASIVIDAGRRA